MSEHLTQLLSRIDDPDLRQSIEREVQSNEQALQRRGAFDAILATKEQAQRLAHPPKPLTPLQRKRRAKARHNDSLQTIHRRKRGW
jgi:thiamine kinase-like enzyme